MLKGLKPWIRNWIEEKFRMWKWKGYILKSMPVRQVYICQKFSDFFTRWGDSILERSVEKIQISVCVWLCEVPNLMFVLQVDNLIWYILFGVWKMSEDFLFRENRKLPKFPFAIFCTFFICRHGGMWGTDLFYQRVLTFHI